MGIRSLGSVESRCCCRFMVFLVLGEDRFRDILFGFFEVRSVEKSLREERSGFRGGVVGGVGVFGCFFVCVDFEFLFGGVSMRVVFRGYCFSFLFVFLSFRFYVFRVLGFGFYFGFDLGLRDDIGLVLVF